MKTLAKTLTALAIVLSFSACQKEEIIPDVPTPVENEPVDSDSKTPEVLSPEEETILTYQAANFFAKNFFNTYYLWSEECAPKLDYWDLSEEPIKGFYNYKHPNDRWGFITDNYQSAYDYFEGIDKTTGINGKYTIYRDSVAFIAKAVYKDSPAEKANIKRGDIFTEFNGQSVVIKDGIITEEITDRVTKIYEDMQNTMTFKYAGSNKTVTITPVTMYQDPILCNKVFNIGGKAIGYLCYDNFVYESMTPLINVFRNFERAGVSELILDLRYNGGGYAEVEKLLASLIAPKAAVRAKDIFTVLDYNEIVNKAYDSADPDYRNTRFGTIHSGRINGQECTFDISDINIEIKKLYVIYTGDSASASEGLIVGLTPYMDVTLFGEQSFGKYCTCSLLTAEAWYEAYREELGEELYEYGIKYGKNWAAYLTLARFTDKNGFCGNYPDGFHIPESNQVSDGFWYSDEQLGDPDEPMLAKVLDHAGYAQYFTHKTKATASLCRITDKPREILDTKKMHPLWGQAIERLTPSHIVPLMEME